jgi:hypothetical protein
MTRLQSSADGRQWDVLVVTIFLSNMRILSHAVATVEESIRYTICAPGGIFSRADNAAEKGEQNGRHAVELEFMNKHTGTSAANERPPFERFSQGRPRHFGT